MANVISLHQRQLFLAPGTVAAYAKVSFATSGTNTQVPVYSDEALTTLRSQPVSCDINGVLPPCYVAAGTALRILATTQADVPLAGYPMDYIVPHTTDTVGADSISFSPTDDLPYDNVQDAIVGAAALSSDQTALNVRALVPWNTGGSSNAFTITPSPALVGYGASDVFVIRPDRSNSGTATLNVNGLGARPLQKIGPAGTPVALQSGDLNAYREIMVVGDGTRFLTTLNRDDPRRGDNSNGVWVKIPTGPGVGNMMFTRVGAIAFDGATLASGEYFVTTLTFPEAFSAAPAPTGLPNIRSATLIEAPKHIHASIRNITTTTMDVVVYNRHASSTPTGQIFVDVSMFGSYADA